MRSSAIIPFALAAALGVAAFPGDALTFEELLRRADARRSAAPEPPALEAESPLARE